MTEQKLMGIVADLFPEGMDSDFHSGYVAGFHGFDPDPCPTKNVRCAEGVVAGKSVREFYLGLSGETDDEFIKISIAELLFLDSKPARKARFTSYGSRQKRRLSGEEKEEKKRSSNDPSSSQFSSFNNLFRLAEQTDSGGSV